MATGITNSSVGDLRQYDIVCYYWGQRPDAAEGVATSNRQWAYNRDYLSFDSSTDTFTVLKDFKAKVKVIGNGARNGTAGNSGRFVLTIRFYVGSTVVITGTINENGDTTPAETAYSFTKNNTFKVTGYHATNVYAVDIGFIIEIA